MKNNSRDPRFKRGKSAKEPNRYVKQAKRCAKKRKERVMYDDRWKKDLPNDNYE
jgi:hypothetical protein